MRRVAALLTAPLLVLGGCDAGERENEGVVPTLPTDPGVTEVEPWTAPADSAVDTGEHVGDGTGIGTGDPAGDAADADDADGAEDAEDGDGDEVGGEVGGEPDPGAVDPDALFGTPPGAGGPYGASRDGVWEVGVAGEVEFSVTGPGSLSLAGVRPSTGWALTGQEVSSDGFDVDLRRGPVSFEVQVELEAGVLEISVDQDIGPAQPGTFFVGEAATVTVAVQGGALVLGAVLIDDGWVLIDRDVDGDEIELDLQRAGADAVELWEFTADLDDGVLEVSIDYEISGPYAG